MSQHKEYTAVGIYSGTGGMSLGVEQAGFKHLLAVDIDKHACESYRLNFPGTDVAQWDMFKMTPQDILNRIGLKRGELSYLHQEPVCTDNSTAGKRNATGRNNDLLCIEAPKAILEMAPMTFTVENVDGVIQGGHLTDVFYKRLEPALNSLKDYHWDFSIMNALDYGTPTHRDRFIVIGVRKDIADSVSFPQPTTINDPSLRIKSVAPWIKWVYTGYGFPASKMKSANNFMYTITKTTNVQVSTITGEKRYLSYDELLLFNGFPSDWKIEGSWQKQWARIGNAVPPPLANAVAAHILKVLNGSGR